MFDELPLFAAAATKRIVTVSELTSEIKEKLEDSFPTLNVAGEISNLSRPASGHCYFVLKDSTAQIKAIVWRSTAQRLSFKPEEGLAVICRGELEVREQRGEYQLIVERLELQGEGNLQLALQRLREKLAKEGLFQAARKRPLPPFPRRIAFVTSPTGAAIRDFLEIACRRWLGVTILVIPARVQGDGAVGEIVAGIERANRIQPPLDVLVVGRGGGSIEDLWSFNDERVVRAIHASRVPVVSAVGHEIDVTLADLVADVRALTPSEAAERVVPSKVDLVARLRSMRQVLDRQLRGRLSEARTRLDAVAGQRIIRRPMELVDDLARRLDQLDERAGRALLARVARARTQLGALAQQRIIRRPLELVHSLAQRLDDLDVRARRSLRAMVTQARTRLDTLSAQRILRRPQELVQGLAPRLDELNRRAVRSLRAMLAQSKERIGGLARSLESLSPLAVLGRGYSLTRRADTGELIRTAGQLSAGDLVRTQLAEGELLSRVEARSEKKTE